MGNATSTVTEWAAEVFNVNAVAVEGLLSHIFRFLASCDLMAGLKKTTGPKKFQDCARVLNLCQNQEHLYDIYVAHVKKLAADESITSRITACRILFAFYGFLSPSAKDEMWKILCRLSVDHDIQVRRKVVAILANLAKEADTVLYNFYIIPVLEKMEEEEKLEPCLEATQLIINICTWPHVPENARLAIIPALLKHASHSSWEARYMIANNLSEVQKSLQAHIVKSGLIAMLPTLMKDPEPKVREAANNQFQAYCEYVTESKEKKLPWT